MLPPFSHRLVATSEYVQRMGARRRVAANAPHWKGRDLLLGPTLLVSGWASTGAAGVLVAQTGLGRLDRPSPVLARRGLAYQAGNTAWWPLVQDNTASSGLGAFLTRMRLQQRLLELALPS